MYFIAHYKILNDSLFLIFSLKHGLSQVGVMAGSCLFFVGNFFILHTLQNISKKGTIKKFCEERKKNLLKKIVLLLTSICVLLLYKIIMCHIHTSPTMERTTDQNRTLFTLQIFTAEVQDIHMFFYNVL